MSLERLDKQSENVIVGTWISADGYDGNTDPFFFAKLMGLAGQVSVRNEFCPLETSVLILE